MKTAFIGHRQVAARNIRERLAEAICAEIELGCKSFTMGTHGEFDSLALSACRQLKKEHKDLEIEVAITSLNKLKRYGELGLRLYADVKTVMYDIEDAHFKRQIILSNRQMIDGCNTLICYVDTSVRGSGARLALNYAESKGLKIVNVYRAQDTPYYGMTNEQATESWLDQYEKIFGKKN